MGYPILDVPQWGQSNRGFSNKALSNVTIFRCFFYSSSKIVHVGEHCPFIFYAIKGEKASNNWNSMFCCVEIIRFLIKLAIGIPSMFESNYESMKTCNIGEI